MARRKRGHPIHGWLILDKPLEMTSTAAVGRIKRLFNAQKAGHAGTLDPLATGILPLALGEATKTTSFVMNGKKSYRFTVGWGVETSTDDMEGEPAETSDLRPTLEAIEHQLPKFTGAIMQIPPKFSAIKIAGNRAYDLARDGGQVQLEARKVVIEKLQIIDMPDQNTTVFEAVCGKGTYVRAIARDLGRALGCFGHIKYLRRTQVGPFAEEDAWTLENLKRLTEEENGEDNGAGHHLAAAALLPVEAALEDLPHLELPPATAARIARGQSVIFRGHDIPDVNGQAYATSKGKLLALVEIENGALRPTRVFNMRS